MDEIRDRYPYRARHAGALYGTAPRDRRLTQTLRDLERDGLVERSAYSVMPPRVEYSVTRLGRTVEEPLHALSVWAQEHMSEVREAQQAYDVRKARVEETLRLPAFPSSPPV